MSLDLYNLADTSYRTQVFYTSGTWVKPRGIHMVQITAIGAGGGGGGGCCKTSQQGGCGGGGGASGTLSRLTIPAIFLTEELIINVGIGGSGGTAGNTSITGGTSGGTGGNTTVDMSNGNGSAPTLLIYATGGGGGGGGITFAIAGTGGSTTAPPSSQQCIYAGLGNFTAIPQQGGTQGGSTAAAINLTYLQTVGTPLCGGTGGGGSGAGANNSGAAGGSIVGGGFGRSITASGTLTRGTDGYIELSPFVSYGGTGGGATTNAVPYLGYDGGVGAYGSGGGGGGTGINLSSGAGGNGGKGGDGIVIINCW